MMPTNPTAENEFGNYPLKCPSITSPSVGLYLYSLQIDKLTTCVITNDNARFCWGENINGQLLDGTLVNRDLPVLFKYDDVAQLVLGRYNSCMITYGLNLKCWGRNAHGEVGDGTTNPHTQNPVTVFLAEEANAVEVVLGTHHSCVIDTFSAVQCWGRNDVGQLGDGTYKDRHTPFFASRFGGDMPPVKIASGKHHVCTIDDYRRIYCWGYNNHGQIGNGTTNNRNSPTFIVLTGGAGAKHITLGSYHTCVIDTDDNVQCWGWNKYGQTRNDIHKNCMNDNCHTPTSVSLVGDAKALQVKAGKFHTCVIDSTNNIQCWGLNTYGFRRASLQSEIVPIPPSIITLVGGRHAIALAIGTQHTCVIDDLRNLQCWGNNFSGQLGDGSKVHKNFPIVISVNGDNDGNSSDIQGDSYDDGSNDGSNDRIVKPVP
jgi:alpha-tubulin suppressor-like RCC1 family protein